MLSFFLRLLKKNGFQVSRYPKGDLKRRIHLINYYKINKIFDVGANIGQYVTAAREFGFKGNIVSFEPLSEAFKLLKENSKKDKRWQINNFAIGDKNGNSIINISSNLSSSSIKDMLVSHESAAPNSKYIGTEEIIIKTLDSCYKDYIEEGDIIYLKIDTQGFEKNVLDGAAEFLEKVVLIQLEMSVNPLYDAELSMNETISYLKSNNFELVGLENGFQDPKTNHLLQVDGIFLNKKYI